MSNTKDIKSTLSFKEFSILSGYYSRLLGGDKILPETTKRLMRFSDELNELRNYDKFTIFKSNVDEMVVINRLRLFSFCEHHLLPFFGYAYIGYIPNGKILGLSKFQRIVDKLSSKPSTQEEITEDISNFINKLLSPKGVGVATNCKHTCMFGRGIKNLDSNVNTTSLTGTFKIHEVRLEFLQRINSL